MDKATVIALAREADLWMTSDERIAAVERFAALIEEHLTYATTHSCHPGCTKPACVAMRKAVEAEREECARICDDADKDSDWPTAANCAAAIRSRP